MSILQRLGRSLDLRSGEGKPLLAAVTFSLLSVAIAVVSRAVSDALFLTTHPIEDVPDFYIVSSLAFVAASMTYSTLVRMVRALRLHVLILCAFAASMLGGRWLLFGDHQNAVFTLCVWLAIMAPLVNIICWNAIADHFDSRQGRRLFPVVFAGSTLGAIFAGLAIGPFINLWGLDNLLYALALLIAAAIPMPFALALDQSRTDAPTRSFIIEGSTKFWRTLREGVTTVSHSRLLRALAWVVFCAALVTNLIDYAFKEALQIRFNKDEIGTFYGYFNAFANVGNLLLQLFVVSRVIERIGVVKVFRILPLTLYAGTLFLTFIPGFVMVVLLKLVDGLLRFTFQNSANEVVLAPISYIERNRAKIFIKGAMNPLGAIAAGVVLTLLEAEGVVPTKTLVIIGLVVLTAWLFLISRISPAYAAQLYASLRQKQSKRTPCPEEHTLFGNQPSSQWRRILESTPRWAPFDQNEDAETPNQASPATLPTEGLLDDSPIIRRSALELLTSLTRKEQAPDFEAGVLDGLLWREIRVAFATLTLRQQLATRNERWARRAANLLADSHDDILYRIFLTLSLKGDLQQIKTAYFALRSRAQRTRAHALDLIDASVEGTDFHRPLMLLLDDIDIDEKIRRAQRNKALAEATTQPLRLLQTEHFPQMQRLIAKVEREHTRQDL